MGSLNSCDFILPRNFALYIMDGNKWRRIQLKHLSLRYALEAVKLQFVFRIPYVKTIFALPLFGRTFHTQTTLAYIGLGVATGDSFLQAFLIADNVFLRVPAIKAC